MNLRDYVASLSAEGREEFSIECGTSVGHMNNIMYGYKPCSPLLASAIERATRGAVRRWGLRPEDWWKIWPELVGKKGAPPIPGMN